jgi:acid phosphatase
MPARPFACRVPVAAFALLLGACAAPAPKPGPPAESPGPAPADNLNAVLWTQTSVEHDLIFREVYRDATERLAAALADPSWDALPREDRTTPAADLPPAVILDIDETVLDNSPYQVRLVREGREYDEGSWAQWCRQARARPLPGVVTFTQAAAARGVRVFYLSNRARDLDAVTLANLRAAGLPVFGDAAFLGLGTRLPGCESVGSGKGCRRRLIGRDHRVLMQFGDQIGDFVDVPANTPDGRRAAVAGYLDWIGERWFVLPNPTYGSWESVWFDGDWSRPVGERRQLKLDALQP